MSIRVFSVTAGPLISLVGLVAACNDDDGGGGKASSSSGATGDAGSSVNTGSSGNTSSSGSSSSSGGVDACKIANGIYSVTHTPVKEMAFCEADTTETAWPPDGGANASLPKGCKVASEDESTCTTVTECEFKSGGGGVTLLERTRTETSVKDGLPEGKVSTKTVNLSDGSVVSECERTFKWSKK